jgi:hypothetical protein
MSEEIKTWLMLGAVGAALYWLYQFFGKPGGPVQSAEQSIANAWVGLTAPPAPQVQGTVLMPDGSTFPTANLTSLGLTWQGSTLTFSTGGQVYALSPNANGSYVAQPFTGLSGYRVRRRARRGR